ncbi:kinase family protein [Salix suchowensis]|nr:kinase family protein [Salix suchowensis]
MDFLKLYLCVVVLLSPAGVQGQQTYLANHQLDCYNNAFNETTKGYLCNGVQSSCQSYLTFRSMPPYNSPVLIAYLLGVPATLIASINNLSSDTATIPTNSQVVVPVNCSCYGRLTTCQSLMSQNSYGDRNLSVGLDLQIPLRCACPTSNQNASGVNYLLTYMVTWGDSISSIAQLFGVDKQRVLDTNKLSSSNIIFPFTPILVPLTTEPTKIEQPSAAPPPAAPSPQTPTLYVGVGIGAALLILLFAAFGFLFWHRKSRKQHKHVSTLEPKTLPSDSTDFTALPVSNDKSWSLSSHDARYAVESLTVYKYEGLQIATGYFAQANLIKGSVYRGSFKGDTAAVKVVKGDVSSEINILKMINHSNVIRLSGFCLHEGNTYLVYEYAENGSLTDWLHSNNTYRILAWKQRVRIAYDVADALNYLHNYTNPSYIHKNLKTSNILLDANMRAKVANFGLARTLENDQDGGLQLTRHVVGTQGYLAPEYIENGVITPKLDVFAFGVVMLELLSGKEAAATAIDKSAGDDLLSVMIVRVLEGDNVRDKLSAFLDPCLRDEYPLDLAFSMAQLARGCVEHDLNTRPSMPQVFMMLSKILSSSLDWDPSDELNRSRSLDSGR